MLKEKEYLLRLFYDIKNFEKFLEETIKSVEEGKLDFEKFKDKVHKLKKWLRRDERIERKHVREYKKLTQKIEEDKELEAFENELVKTLSRHGEIEEMLEKLENSNPKEVRDEIKDLMNEFHKILINIQGALLKFKEMKK